MSDDVKIFNSLCMLANDLNLDSTIALPEQENIHRKQPTQFLKWWQILSRTKVKAFPVYLV